MIEAVTCVPWRLAVKRWTVDRLEARVNPVPPPQMPFEGARVQRERITKQDVGMSWRMGRDRKGILIDVAADLKPASKQHHKEQSVSSDEAM